MSYLVLFLLKNYFVKHNQIHQFKPYARACTLTTSLSATFDGECCCPPYTSFDKYAWQYHNDSEIHNNTWIPIHNTFWIFTSMPKNDSTANHTEINKLTNKYKSLASANHGPAHYNHRSIYQSINISSSPSLSYLQSRQNVVRQNEWKPQRVCRTIFYGFWMSFCSSINNS